MAMPSACCLNASGTWTRRPPESSNCRLIGRTWTTLAPGGNSACRNSGRALFVRE